MDFLPSTSPVSPWTDENYFCPLHSSARSSTALQHCSCVFMESSVPILPQQEMVNSRTKIWCVKLELIFMVFYCFIFSYVKLHLTFHSLIRYFCNLSQPALITLNNFVSCVTFVSHCSCPFPCYLWVFWTEQTSLQIPEISTANFPLLSEMTISSVLCFLAFSHFTMPVLPLSPDSLVSLKVCGERLN